MCYKQAPTDAVNTTAEWGRALPLCERDNMNEATYDHVGAIIAYESGELDNEAAI